MEVAVWSGAWGLPSFDAECLSVMAFCKFAEIPANFVETGNLLRSPSFTFPVLKDKSGKKVAGMEEILQYCCDQFKNKFENVENPLADCQFVAYSSLLEEKLRPALDHYFWVDSQNFTGLTRPWYAKALIFPLSMFIPTNKNRNISDKLFYCVGDKFLSEKDREYKIYRDAKETINLLSCVLAENDFFGGTKPSAIDALVFGYLAPLIKAPFPNQSLQQHVKNCPNLASFCQKILDQYFPMNQQEIDEQQKTEDKRQEEQQSAAQDFPNRMRNSLFAAVLAVSAMVAYAFVSGLIVVQIEDDNDGGNNVANKEEGKRDSQYSQFYGADNDENESGES